MNSAPLPLLIFVILALIESPDCPSRSIAAIVIVSSCLYLLLPKACFTARETVPSDAIVTSNVRPLPRAELVVVGIFSYVFAVRSEVPEVTVKCVGNPTTKGTGAVTYPSPSLVIVTAVIAPPVRVTVPVAVTF